MKRIAPLLKKRYSISQLKWPLLLLFIFEIVTVVCWTSIRPKYHADKGFLVKSGKKYIIFWIDEERKQASASMDSLSSALEFANTELNLQVANSTFSYHPLESLWARTNANGYAVYWKTFDSGYINRLTFNSMEDANTYEKYLKMGAYTPSPIGHSLALLPIKKN